MALWLNHFIAVLLQGIKSVSRRSLFQQRPSILISESVMLEAFRAWRKSFFFCFRQADFFCVVRVHASAIVDSVIFFSRCRYPYAAFYWLGFDGYLAFV